MYETESDSGPKGTFEIYKAEADTLLKQGDYRKAIESYTIVSTRVFSLNGLCRLMIKTCLDRAVVDYSGQCSESLNG